MRGLSLVCLAGMVEMPSLMHDPAYLWLRFGEEWAERLDRVAGFCRLATVIAVGPRQGPDQRSSQQGEQLEAPGSLVGPQHQGRMVAGSRSGMG